MNFKNTLRFSFDSISLKYSSKYATVLDAEV